MYNFPVQNEFVFDEDGVGSFQLKNRIDLDVIRERFDFPETIVVEEDPYNGGGVVWDKKNALKIHQAK